MSNQNENDLIDLLRQIKEVLDKYNVEFWLECGTLLGAVREGKFLAWEQDIDLGAWHEKVPDSTRKSIAEELCKKGYRAQTFESYMNIRKTQVHADINFYRPDKDKVVVPLLKPTNLTGKYLFLLQTIFLNPYFYEVEFGNKVSRSIRSILILVSRVLPFFLRKQAAKVLAAIYRRFSSKNVSWAVPAHYFANLASMKFYGMEFKVPPNTEEYLEYRYGQDWRIPRKDWIGSRDDGARAMSREHGGII